MDRTGIIVVTICALLLGAWFIQQRKYQAQRPAPQPATIHTGNWPPNHYRRSNSLSAWPGDAQLLPRAGQACVCGAPRRWLLVWTRPFLPSGVCRKRNPGALRNLAMKLDAARGETVHDTRRCTVGFPILYPSPSFHSSRNLPSTSFIPR